MFVLLALFCLLLVRAAASQSEKTEVVFDAGVTPLNSQSLPVFVKQNRFAIIDFYYPECPHCARLAPEFARASQIVKKVAFGAFNGRTDEALLDR